MQTVDQIFSEKGGRFVTPFSVFKENLRSVKAILFDWDGVFNGGKKGGGVPSGFSEIDSMGTNLLRYGLWLEHSRQLPFTALITGADNPAAAEMCTREHFDAVYFKVPDKRKAFEHILATVNIQPYESAFVFDDVLDLPVAKNAGLRIMVTDPAKIWLNTLIDGQFTDYITAFEAGSGAVREACELMLASMSIYEQVLDERMNFSDSYKTYLSSRNETVTAWFTLDKTGQISVSHHV